MAADRAQSIPLREDIAEVPAAVVCARCGSPECNGCEPAEELTQPSGVIAIVPWERPTSSLRARLWSTMHATTLSSKQFFSALGKGGYAMPFLFALVAELAAVGSTAVVLLLVVFAIWPSLGLHMMLRDVAGMMMIKAVVAGVPAFTGLLIGAHLVHGLALERAAKKKGARGHRNQALRFALYACGWDLGSSPVGLLHELLSGGVVAVFRLLRASVLAPAASTPAFLRSIYRLGEADCAAVQRQGGWVAVSASVVAIVVLLVMLVAVALR